MPSWIIKAAIQGALSRLPQPQRYNRLLQKYVTHSLDLSDDYFLYKWQQCDRQVRDYFKYRPDADKAFVALELGTGWFPITPIGFALHGASRVYTIDMHDLLSHEQLVDALRFYEKMLRDGRVQARSEDALARVESLLARAPQQSARDLLSELGIESIVGDARNSGLPDGSVDLLCSNNTLEHIPGDDIAQILTAFRRLASDRGLMIHFVDMADHYANFDRSISVYHFLKYSDRMWTLFNNELQYLNRLRVSDFRSMHADAGFRVLEEDNNASPELLDQLELAPEFRHYARADLAVFDTWMVSEPV